MDEKLQKKWRPNCEGGGGGGEGGSGLTRAEN